MMPKIMVRKVRSRAKIKGSGIYLSAHREKYSPILRIIALSPLKEVKEIETPRGNPWDCFERSGRASGETRPMPGEEKRERQGSVDGVHIRLLPGRRSRRRTRSRDWARDLEKNPVPLAGIIGWRPLKCQGKNPGPPHGFPFANPTRMNRSVVPMAGSRGLDGKRKKPYYAST
jgi:hypothetical protein